MLEFKPALTLLQESQVFKDYQKKNTTSYLTNSLFIDDWQLNYFSPQTHQVTTFTVNASVKKKTLETENKKFPKLNNTKVNIDLKKALKISNHSTSKDQKTIVILQTENSEPIWNITIPLPSLKVIQVKISAESGKVLEESEKNIIELR
jgi:uncharacterized membrane protein YkoI